jgi:hypothetical protein
MATYTSRDEALSAFGTNAIRPGQARAQTYRAGVTGHRALSQPMETYAKVRCHELLAQARAEHTRLQALTALAEGADTLFAEVALTLRIPLRVVVPFRGFEQDFEEGPPRQRYHQLLGLARWKAPLRFAERSDEAYWQSGLWVAERVDLLIAIWDGKPARGHGGTAEVVEYARKRGVRVEIVPVER